MKIELVHNVAQQRFCRVLIGCNQYMWLQ